MFNGKISPKVVSWFQTTTTLFMHQTHTSQKQDYSCHFFANKICETQLSFCVKNLKKSLQCTCEYQDKELIIDNTMYEVISLQVMLEGLTFSDNDPCVALSLQDPLH